jgi:hypothetical protein
VEQIKVRNTQLVDAASCLRKHYYVWELGLKPRKTDSKLQVGSLVHKFLEVYEGYDITIIGPVQAIHDAYEAMFNVFKEFYMALPDGDEEGRDIAIKSHEQAKDIADRYVKWRSTTDLSPLIQAEAEFEVNLGPATNVEVVLKGTMDGVGKTEAGLWLREYKTCASIAEKLKQYTLDKQTRRYVAAMRIEGIELVGVELVLLSKTRPVQVEDFILKAKGSEGLISADKKKWSKATYDQALQIAELGNFAPEDSKKGLTEQGFHDILKMLIDRDSPYFRVERLHFNDFELVNTLEETMHEAQRIEDIRNHAKIQGPGVWTRNTGIMGMNCKGCGMRTICEMDLKGIDTTLMIQEHFTQVDPITITEESIEEDDSSEDAS